MLGRWTLEPTRNLGSYKGVRAENIWDTEIFGGYLVLLLYPQIKVNGKRTTSPKTSIICIWYNCAPPKDPRYLEVWGVKPSRA